MTIFDFFIRIVCAVFFGFLIGLERQLTGHVAGIRVNVLVSLGAAMFVLFSLLTDAPDPTRIAAQIVTGVGFLCSGIIVKEGANVRGINTAATIWCTAAIGVLTSSGLLLYAMVATAVLLLVNVAFRFVADLVPTLGRFDEQEHTYRVSTICAGQKEYAVRSVLLRQAAETRLTLVGVERADIPAGAVDMEGAVGIEAELCCGGRRRDQAAESLVERICLEEGVQRAGWELV